jgi:flagellar biosynthesis/type III secretory pathway M-ring protein FliF/YscJ
MEIVVSIDKILKAVKQNPTAVLTVVITSIAALFAMLFYTEHSISTSTYTVEMERIRREYIDYQLLCNNQQIKLREDCRHMLDSLEDVYYTRFKLLERRVDFLTYKLESK